LLVWLSLAVHIGLIAGFFYFFKKRSVLSFAIAWYLLSLLMVCNIIFDIGATMGERLIYNASLGFAIALAYLLYNSMEKIKPVLAGLIVLLIVLCGFKTVERNTEWKNDYTLFSHDINVVPNSLLVNSNVAYTLINRSDLETDEQARTAHLNSAVAMLNKSISMQPVNAIAFMNKGVAYLKLRQPDSVISNLDKVRTINATYTQLPELYYHAGEQFYANKQYPQAIAAWQVALKLKPDYAQAQNSIKTLMAPGLVK
jgi:tetratricopeptide (TPR) repeat protein